MAILPHVGVYGSQATSGESIAGIALQHYFNINWSAAGWSLMVNR